MELFLVQGEVTKRKYEAFYAETFKDIRLVKAVSEESAVNKWEKYWNDKSSEYSVYYSTSLKEVSGVIT